MNDHSTATDEYLPFPLDIVLEALRSITADRETEPFASLPAYASAHDVRRALRGDTAMMYGSVVMVAQALRDLCKLGYAVRENRGRLRYAPTSR